MTNSPCTFGGFTRLDIKVSGSNGCLGPCAFLITYVDVYIFITTDVFSRPNGLTSVFQATSASVIIFKSCTRTLRVYVYKAS